MDLELLHPNPNKNHTLRDITFSKNIEFAGGKEILSEITITAPLLLLSLDDVFTYFKSLSVEIDRFAFKVIDNNKTIYRISGNGKRHIKTFLNIIGNKPIVTIKFKAID